MKPLFLFLLLALCQTLPAQITMRVDNSLYTTGGSTLPIMGAAPVDNKRYIDLAEGSPFFSPDWAKSKLISEQGAVYADVPVKLNLLENNVYFMDGEGKELVIGTPLQQVIFPKDAAGRQAHFINGSILPEPKKGWFQLLVNDTISLVKGYNKKLETHTSYGSAPEYRISTTENFFVFYKNQPFEVRKPSDLTKVMPDKKKEIEAHLKSLGSKGSREDQMAAVVVFMNTLGG